MVPSLLKVLTLSNTTILVPYKDRPLGSLDCLLKNHVSGCCKKNPSYHPIPSVALYKGLLFGYPTHQAEDVHNTKILHVLVHL